MRQKTKENVGEIEWDGERERMGEIEWKERENERERERLIDWEGGSIGRNRKKEKDREWFHERKKGRKNGKRIEGRKSVTSGGS